MALHTYFLTYNKTNREVTNRERKLWGKFTQMNGIGGDCKKFL